MTKVVRVAQVVGRMVGGGVEATVMNYYRCLDHSRVQFDFIIQNDSTVVPRDEIRSLGGHIYVRIQLLIYMHVKVYFVTLGQTSYTRT